MKAKLQWAILFSLFLMSPLKLTAQAGCVTVIPDYGSYVDVSFDSTNIYTSVVVDGTASMIINTGLPGCSSVNLSNVVHVPIAVNVISTAGGNPSTGGQSSGSPVCPTCYLSQTNNQALPWTAGATYDFQWYGGVACSLAGTIFSTQGLWDYYPTSAIYSFAYYNNPPTNTTAYYKLNCPGSTHPTCGHSGIDYAYVGGWIQEIQLYNLTLQQCMNLPGLNYGVILPISSNSPAFKCW